MLALCLAMKAPHSSAAGPAGIKLDGTLGPSAAALAGPMYAITQNLGKLSGGNLFFSFQYFNVATGETALFTTTSAGIGNVISRVTGGYASTIDGTIQLQAASGAPNFFLINPSGVTFTANAVIDVPAAFYVSTANYLKFSDGNFYVDPSKMSTLSAATPEAFGFLGTTRAPVNLEGANLSAGVNGAGEFQIAAGDVTVDGGGSQVGITNTTGAIRITAVGSASAAVPLSGPFATSDGTVTITDGGLLWSQGLGAIAGAGVAINAGSLLIDGQSSGAVTGIYAGGSNSAPGPITVAIGNDAQIINGGSITSFNPYPSAAANVSLSANTLTIDGGNESGFTGIESVAAASGTGASVQVTVAGATTISDGGAIYSGADAAGNGGEIALSTGTLLIDGGNESSFTGIESVTAASGTGASVQVAVAGATTISDGGAIFSLAEAVGNGGDIVLSSASLQLEATDAAVNTLIEASTQGSGNSGSVQVSADSLTMTGPQSITLLPVQISTFTAVGSSGAAGAVDVQVSGDVSMTGAAGIVSNTNSSGNAGQVSVQALGTLSMGDDSEIFTQTNAGAGNGGNVSVTAAALDITSSASTSITNIGTSSYSAGDAGAITIHAGSLSIDGAGSNLGFTGIDSFSEGSGAGGAIQVVVAGAATIANGGIISSTAYAQGNGGNVSMSAAALDIEGVAATAGTSIATASYASGSAGAITVHAGSLSIDGAGSNQGFTGIESSSNASGAGGAIQIDVTGAATIANGGLIDSTAYAQGNAGNIVMSAGNLLLQDTGNASRTGIYASTYAAGSSGTVQVTADALTMFGPASAAAGNPVAITSSTDAGATGVAGDVNIDVSGNISLTGGAIASNTYSSGAGGQVTVKALGTVSLLAGADIDAASTGGTGNAGGISLTAAALDIAGQGSTGETGVIASAGEGNAGNIQIHVGTLSIDGGPGPALAGIDANTYGTGTGGQVQIDVAGTATIADGGLIFTDTFGQGNAGSIDLTAANLVINAQGNTSEGTGIEAGTYGAGNAGSIHINAGSLTMSSYETTSMLPVYIESGAEAGSSGAAGDVTVDVTGNISITGEAEIGSDTITSRNAGQVVVNAGGVIYLGDGGHLSSSSNAGSGNSGDISVTAAALNIEGQGSLLTGISTESFTAGNSGNIRVQVGSLLINGGGAGGSGAAIDSEVYPEGTGGVGGAGGSIIVNVAGNATLENGSKISTTSYGSGPAGDVSVSAGSLSLGGGSYRSIISSGARAGSAGQPGNVTIDAGTLDILSNGSINISNDATISVPSAITPTKIAITANQIDMNDGLITAASTGNVAASAIDIRYGSWMRLDPSTISTSSQDGNGGPITIDGAGPLLLSHSNITTSVLGTSNGNGGDISINVPVVALDSGAIQANTLAPLASGGTITINAQALVPSYQSFTLGGNAVAFDPTATGLNVVQAAAPDGVSGALSVTVPTLDLGNALLGLTGRPSAPVTLGHDLCRSTRGSSLAVAGRGGVAPTAYDPLWIDPAQAWGEAAASNDRFIGSKVMAACR
jgi:filamentous hemagglutinin family protein